MMHAHRASWMFANGPIPEGMYVLHRCDNRRCVNPGHLFLGTDRDNMDDMIAKGRCRSPKGQRNGSAVLTESDVIEIRRQLADKVPQREIGRRFGVAQTTIEEISTGRNWAWLSGAAEVEDRQD